MGQDISLADLAMMPIIVRMDDINLGYMWETLPAVQAWFDTIQARPEYEQDILPRVLLTQKYPHLANLKKSQGSST